MGGGAVTPTGPYIKVTGSRFVSEGVSPPYELGDLSVENDGGHSWTISVKTDGDNKFDISSGKLRIDNALDYETKVFHDVTLEATATGQDPVEKTLRYNVINVIEAPVFESPPVITGIAQVGATASLQTEGLLQSPDGDGAERTYQWFLDGETPEAIEGATDTELDTSGFEGGEEIFLRETATNGAGSVAEDSNVLGPFELPDEVETSLLWGDSEYLTILHMGV